MFFLFFCYILGCVVIVGVDELWSWMVGGVLLVMRFRGICWFCLLFCLVLGCVVGVFCYCWCWWVVEVEWLRVVDFDFGMYFGKLWRDFLFLFFFVWGGLIDFRGFFFFLVMFCVRCFGGVLLVMMYWGFCWFFLFFCFVLGCVVGVYYYCWCCWVVEVECWVLFFLMLVCIFLCWDSCYGCECFFCLCFLRFV